MDLGSEAFALCEGLTNVTPKKIRKNLNSFKRVSSIRNQVSGKQRVGFTFGGSEAFALCEGLTNVKTQKNFAGNLNSFKGVSCIRNQVSGKQ